MRRSKRPQGQIEPHLALGAKSSGRAINVTAAAFALGLPAPRDVDDLLQNELAGEVRLILDAIDRGEVEPPTIAFPTSASHFWSRGWNPLRRKTTWKHDIRSDAIHANLMRKSLRPFH